MNVIDRMLGTQEFADSGLHTGEAYILWTQLQARYDTLELTQFYAGMSKDMDFRALVHKGIKSVIEPQIKKLEDTMRHYKIIVPPPPPVDINLPANIESARDVAMFRIILAGSQTGLTVHIKAINICINDSLRNMFMGFLMDDLKMYDNLVKYGKAKGWVHNPPAYKHCQS